MPFFGEFRTEILKVLKVKLVFFRVGKEFVGVEIELLEGFCSNLRRLRWGEMRSQFLTCFGVENGKEEENGEIGKVGPLVT